MVFLRKNKTTKVQSAPDASELQKTEKFATENIVPAKKGRKCVDGRYLPTQASGMIARPGADGGYVMAIKAVSRKKNLGILPEECFNAVYKVVTKNKGKFYLHTDHHTDPQTGVHHGLIGCGHLAKAARRLYSHEYDVRSKDIRKLVSYARNLSEIENEVELVNLDGVHMEKGILIINSDKYTVNSSTFDRSQMFFVYDAKRDNEFMKKLVKEMNIKGLTYEDMKKESDLQLNTTLQNLALGLPIYNIEIDNSKKTKVTPAGRVGHQPLIKRFRNIATSLYSLN